jgi:peptidoglycan hydrolase-like protein with peptidoglycan-binding domain
MLYRLGSRGSGQKEADESAGPRPETGDGGGTLVIRKNRALAAGLAAVILSSLISWGAASRIRSPAEVAARTAAPRPSPIAVPVEKKVLSSDVVARGTVRYGAPQSVLLPGSSIRKGSAILTSAPEKGKDLTEGSVAFTISGRPALVLQGAVPAYRDITPGAVGDDVRQLQEGLVRLGFRPGRTDGVYDDRTGLAVAAWYLKGGWTPSGPSEEQLQALRSAQADWFSAESDLLGAQEALTAARNDYEIAKQRAAAAAKVAHPGAPTTTAPAARPAAASSPDEQAASRQQQERVNADLRVKKARRDLAAAEEKEKAAQARLDEARRRRPPPSNEEYAELSKRAQDAQAKVAAAKEELTAAEDAYAAASDRSGGGSSSAAESSPSSSSSGAPDQQVVLDAATAQAEARKAADAVAFAQKKVGLANQRVGSGPTGTKLGIQIPAGEILFFPVLPARVDDVKLKVGEEATGAVMTVTSSRLVVESALSAADAKLVREGDAVAIRATDSGVEATGTVTHIATSPGTNGVDPQRYYLEVTPTGLDVSLAGASVVQTISVRTTEGEVLAVPVAALSMASDGTTRVQVQETKGQPRYVTVEPGLAAKGLVAVNPVGGELGPGDLVVVGASGSGTKEKGSGHGGK